MSDWTDFLEGLSGGFMGITKGLTAGAEPFKAWEQVRNASNTNDLGDVTVRNAQLTQNAYESMPDFYGNVAAAKDVGNRFALSKGNSDIFGIDRALAGQQNLSSPDFLATIAGLDPSDPEYRAKVAAALGQTDPMGGIKAYDSFGVDKLQQQNVNEQAALALLEGYVQQNDKFARVERLPDGTIVVYDGLGQPTRVDPDLWGKLLTKTAASLQPAGPQAAYSAGIKDEIAIQKANTETIKAVRTGQITPQQAIKYFTEQRQGIGKLITDAMAERAGLMKQDGFSQQDPVIMNKLQEVEARIQKHRTAMETLNTLSQYVAATGSIPPPQMLQGPGQTNAPRPTGGSAMTAPRPPAGALAQRAAGAAAPQPSWGRAGPPANLPSARDTGLRPITETSQPQVDQILEFLRNMGIDYEGQIQ